MSRFSLLCAIITLCEAAQMNKSSHQNIVPANPQSAITAEAAYKKWEKTFEAASSEIAVQKFYDEISKQPHSNDWKAVIQTPHILLKLQKAIKGKKQDFCGDRKKPWYHVFSSKWCDGDDLCKIFNGDCDKKLGEAIPAPKKHAEIAADTLQKMKDELKFWQEHYYDVVSKIVSYKSKQEFESMVDKLETDAISWMQQTLTNIKKDVKVYLKGEVELLQLSYPELVQGEFSKIGHVYDTRDKFLGILKEFDLEKLRQLATIKVKVMDGGVAKCRNELLVLESAYTSIVRKYFPKCQKDGDLKTELDNMTRLNLKDMEIKMTKIKQDAVIELLSTGCKVSVAPDYAKRSITITDSKTQTLDEFHFLPVRTPSSVWSPWENKVNAYYTLDKMSDKHWKILIAFLKLDESYMTKNLTTIGKILEAKSAAVVLEECRKIEIYKLGKLQTLQRRKVGSCTTAPLSKATACPTDHVPKVDCPTGCTWTVSAVQPASDCIVNSDFATLEGVQSFCELQLKDGCQSSNGICQWKPVISTAPVQLSKSLSASKKLLTAPTKLSSASNTDATSTSHNSSKASALKKLSPASNTVTTSLVKKLVTPKIQPLVSTTTAKKGECAAVSQTADKGTVDHCGKMSEQDCQDPIFKGLCQWKPVTQTSAIKANSPSKSAKLVLVKSASTGGLSAIAKPGKCAAVSLTADPTTVGFCGKLSKQQCKDSKLKGLCLWTDN